MKNINPKVSVVIPTIGRPKYIRHAIASLINQDYENIEILISDNNPDVNTKDLLGDSIDPRIKIVNHNVRLDFNEHMNYCYSAASGDYVMILSDDDLLTENYISSMVKLAIQNSSISVFLGAQKILNEEDYSLDFIGGATGDQVFSGEEFIVSQITKKSNFRIITYLSLFAKKKLILQQGGHPIYPDGSNGDNFLFLSLALHGNVGLVSTAAMGYRVYPTSAGLSTPFSLLFKSTVMYHKDVNKLINKSNAISPVKLKLLMLLGSTKMLTHRLIFIYRKRIGLINLINFMYQIYFTFFLKNLYFLAKNN